MNQTQFAKLFSRKSGIKLETSKHLTSIFVECLQDAIIHSHEIKFKNFGSISVYRHPGFYRKNRYTQEQEYIKTSAFMKFKPANELKRKLNYMLSEYLKDYDEDNG